MARNLSALVVDPNLDTRLDTTHVLRQVGFDLAGEAPYGNEAVFLAAEEHPNVILVSLEDPPQRALATLEALQLRAPDTPVLVYSSSAEPQMMRAAMQAGARDFLVRPLHANELRDAIHSLLEAEEQRQLARWSEQSAATARGTVVTVAGAKGGIGKTTLASNVAIALRRVTGQEVALVDADAQFGDVGVMLDLDIQKSIADLARDEREITRETIAAYLARHNTGIDVLGAASDVEDWRAMQPEHMTAIAQALGETHEFVVVDTPGVMNELVAASLNAASVVLLVTSLDVSSVKDTKTALRILESWALPRERVRLIANDNTHAGAVTAEDVAQATGVPVSTAIPYDSRVGMTVQTGVPVVLSDPGSRFSRAVTGIAESIAGVGEGASEQGQGRLRLVRLPLMRRRA